MTVSSKRNPAGGCPLEKMAYNLTSITYSVSVDKGFLRTVQKTADATDYSAILNIGIWVVLIAVILGGLIYLLNRYLLNPNTAELPMERFEVRDADKIHSILDEADARKSVMELRIPEYRYEPYKCSLLDYRKNEHTLIVEDPPERGPDHDFKNKTLVVNFVINYRDKQQFYSFTTLSEGIIPIKMRGFKRAVVLRIPTRLQIRQRRNAVRIEPPLDYETMADLVKNNRYHVVPIEDIELSEELRIDDISRDGMKLAYQKGSALEDLKKGDTFAIRFYLNSVGLGLDAKTNDYIFTEVEVMHNQLKRGKMLLMGVRFTRRGTIKEDKLFFERLQALTNDDIHKWVTALYARQLRREKGLEQKRFEYVETEEEPE